MVLDDALIDVYALLPARSAAAVRSFFNVFLSNPTSASLDYSPEDVLRLADAAPDPCAPANYYFTSPAPTMSIVAAMVCFCGDGALVVGLSTPTTSARDTASRVTQLLQALADQLGAKDGYALLETPPATDSVSAFLSERDWVGAPCLTAGAVISVSDPDAWLGPPFLSS